MKYSIIILFFISIHGICQCPPQGDDKNPNIIKADLLKNRYCFVAKNKANPHNFSDLVKDKIQDTSLIYIDAYITSIKISGTESCECHQDDKSMLDYHIYIADKNTTDKSKNQIVEVSRYSRLFNRSLTYDYVNSLVGHKVRIYGYTFMDEEHKSAIGSWRAGIQEIHPVFWIDKID